MAIGWVRTTRNRFEQRGTGRSIPVPLDSTIINLKSAHEDLIMLMNHYN
jgi:hypothetical protein